VVRVVYSSGPDGGQARDAKKTPATGPQHSLAPQQQTVRVRRERRGRRGKTVTVAAPFVLIRGDVLTLLKGLKKRCGGGGTVRSVDGPAYAIEIQGDHVDSLISALNELGYKAGPGGGEPSGRARRRAGE